jgi:glycine hydroxymethyltransferase
MGKIEETDPAIAEALDREATRQVYQIELIASENYVSRAVLEAQGSIFTNKYAEGYAGRRYYGGCENMDTVELLAIERARRLFGAEHVNVQPYAGSIANLAAYLAVVRPGARIMGLSLSHGGHLTHGSPVNYSGFIFEAVHYEVDSKTDQLNYAVIEKQAKEHHPQVIMCGATAYPRVIDFERFRWIADSVGAYLIADISHVAGLVATGLHPSPIPYAHITTTTTHKTLRGPRGGMIMTSKELAKAVDKWVFPGVQGGPLMHVIAAKAVAFGEALQPEFKGYIQSVMDNAKRLGEVLTQEGFRLVSGGTDNHLMLVDLTPFDITGAEAENLLHSVGITLNKNTIPGDTRPPREASGVRIGTPAVTTRGFGLLEMEKIGRLMGTVIRNRDDSDVLQQASQEIRALCEPFPVPGITDK